MAGRARRRSAGLDPSGAGHRGSRGGRTRPRHGSQRFRGVGVCHRDVLRRQVGGRARRRSRGGLHGAAARTGHPVVGPRCLHAALLGHRHPADRPADGAGRVRSAGPASRRGAPVVREQLVRGRALLGRRGRCAAHSAGAARHRPAQVRRLLAADRGVRPRRGEGQPVARRHRSAGPRHRAGRRRRGVPPVAVGPSRLRPRTAGVLPAGPGRDRCGLVAHPSRARPGLDLGDIAVQPQEPPGEVGRGQGAHLAGRRRPRRGRHGGDRTGPDPRLHRRGGTRAGRPRRLVARPHPCGDRLRDRRGRLAAGAVGPGSGHRRRGGRSPRCGPDHVAAHPGRSHADRPGPRKPRPAAGRPRRRARPLLRGRAVPGLVRRPPRRHRDRARRPAGGHARHRWLRGAHPEPAVAGDLLAERNPADHPAGGDTAPPDDRLDHRDRQQRRHPRPAGSHHPGHRTGRQRPADRPSTRRCPTGSPRPEGVDARSPWDR